MDAGMVKQGVGGIGGMQSLPKLYKAAGSYGGLMNWLYPGMKTAAASKAMMGSLALVGITLGKIGFNYILVLVQ